MKKHIDSFNKQKCLTVTAKGAKFKTTQGKTESLCGSVDTKLRKKNDYVLFNPPRDTKLKSKIAVPKSSLPVFNEQEKDTPSTLSSKLLEDLPIKPKKRIGTTTQFDNYCLFDPKTDFFNEREHVLGTIPETHAVDSSNTSTFVNFPDSFNSTASSNNEYVNTTESYDYFDEMYNDDGCEMAEMSNVKEINDSKTNISLFIRIPSKQNKAIQYSRDVTEESLLPMESQTLQNDIQTASDSMNIHELITVIKKKIF